jgi:hypothetical protein
MFFILKELTERGIPPNIVARGNQIIELISQNQVTIKDSYLFFHAPLANLPKMFNFKEEKGFFPHSFNKPENYDYNGKIPDKSVFEFQKMDKRRREEFEIWYSNQENKNWNFRQELKKYAFMDVYVLYKACSIYRDDELEMNGLVPFYVAKTVAQYATIVFRNNYLNNNLPILRMDDNDTLSFLKEQQSQKAIKFLEWESKRIGQKILHAGNCQKEITIAGYKIDGFTKHTIYEIYGY